MIVGIIKNNFISCACEDTYRFLSLNLPFKFLLKAVSEKSYKVYLTKLNINKNLGLRGKSKKTVGCFYGGCSLMAEYTVVVSDIVSGNLIPCNNERAREFRGTRVRFSPSTLNEVKEWFAKSDRILASTLQK